MSLFKKKSKDEEDLSIISDYKEPFSWSNFWDEHVIGRFKKIKEFLRDKGILYFLLSPFQYKNRLIMKLLLIFLGVMIGVVPRSIHMVNNAKSRNAASEIANIKSGITNGSILVTALSSGQYKDTHLLAFNINGETSDGVPSTTGGYNVELSQLRGVTDAEHVKYRYKVIPIDQSNRLLLVYVDNSKQNDDTGIYNLDVRMKGTAHMKKPLEVVLSKGQKNTSVYKDGDINLSALSTILTQNAGNGKTTISDSLKELDKSIDVYKVNEQRLNASGMTIAMTTDKVKDLVKQQLILPKITDTSTTKNIDSMNADQPQVPVVISSITYKGNTYDNSSQATTDAANNATSTSNAARDTELPNLSTLMQNIQTQIAAVNSARTAKYNALINLETVLNQSIKPSDMSKEMSVK